MTASIMVMMTTIGFASTNDTSSLKFHYKDKVKVVNINDLYYGCIGIVVGIVPSFNDSVLKYEVDGLCGDNDSHYKETELMLVKARK